MACRLQRSHYVPHRSRNRRLHLDNAIIDHKRNLETPSSQRSQAPPPRYRRSMMIKLPRRRARQRLHIPLDSRQVRAHRARNRANNILSRAALHNQQDRPKAYQPTQSQRKNMTNFPLSYGCLPGLGANPYNPHNPAGIRIEPPKSVPIPSGLPLAATRDASPPELPPEMRLRFRGWTHCPKTWLYESDIIIDCGRLVFT